MVGVLLRYWRGGCWRLAFVLYQKNKNAPKFFRGVLVDYEIMETLKNLFRNFLDCRNHFATDVEGSGFALC